MNFRFAKCFVLLSAMAATFSAVASQLTAGEILAASDRARGGGLPGIEWQLKITSHDPFIDGDVRELKVIASEDNSLAATTFPPRAAGGRLLQVGRNMWYARADLSKPVSISSRQKMVGPAANGDIASTNYYKDYDATLVREEKVNSEDAYVLDLVGKNKWVTYDRIVYWVSKTRLVPLKADFYSVSGKLFKSAVFECNNEILYNGRRYPFISKMFIQDAINKDTRSLLEFKNVELRSVAPDEFSVAALGR